MIAIRAEHHGDIKAINNILKLTYPTSMQLKLVNALRKNKHLSISLVALIDSEVVGYIAFSRVEINLRPGNGVCMDPLAVLPAFQHQGIGSALIREGIRACSRSGFGFVVAMGKPKYYKQFGFIHAEAYGLTNRYGTDGDFIAMELQEDMISKSGSVTYQTEFGGTSNSVRQTQ